jgi:DNA-binding transcriptional ArsR family regulator
MNDIKIQSKRSEIGEAIGTLSGIVTYGIPSFQGLSTHIKAEEKKAIAFFENMRHKGLLLGEFMLAFGADLSVEDFIEKISALDQVSFFYHFFSELFPRDIIEEALVDRSILKTYIKDNAYDDIDNINDLIKSLDQMDEIKVYIETALLLSHRWNLSHASLTNEALETFIKSTADKLKRLAPLEYAQQLMGKKFRRTSDYSHYMFIPTYYGGLNCIRFFNDETLLVLDRVGPSWDSVSSDSLAKTMKVLGDSTRLEIMSYITDRPSYGIELSEKFGVSRPTISHHLEQMNGIGLVHIERVKNTKYYSLNKRRYEALLKELREYILKE